LEFGIWNLKFGIFLNEERNFMWTFKFGSWRFGFGTDMNNGRKRPLALIILDGWGYSPKKEGNAIALAHTPFYDEISQNYPRTLLAASGSRVGLTPDAAGNSEVGHLNIGAGRIVQTDVANISNAIKTGEFFENKALKDAFAKAKAGNSAVHLIGLLSDGDIHSSPANLFALIKIGNARRAPTRCSFIRKANARRTR